MRHGETEYNLKHIWGGDPELNSKGKEQAREIARCLKEVKFSGILFHSPKKRAIQTAKVIAETISTELVEVQELTEMRYGKIEELNLEETEQKFPGMLAERDKRIYSWKLFEGENYIDLRNRVRGFLEKLKLKKDNFSIVGHKMINRAILGELLDLSEDEIPYIVIPNDGLFEIDLESQKIWNIDKGFRREGWVDIRNLPR